MEDTCHVYCITNRNQKAFLFLVKGVACEKDINECKSEPCENGGNCTDGVNQYTCDCSPGYSGGNCEVNVDDCWPEPCVNGICIDKVNGYSCDCFEGFEVFVSLFLFCKLTLDCCTV